MRLGVKLDDDSLRRLQELAERDSRPLVWEAEFLLREWLRYERVDSHQIEQFHQVAECSK